MKIKLTQHGDRFFQADCTDFPGSPPVGRGPTPEAALVELFFMILFTGTKGGINPIPEESWTQFLSYDKGYGMVCENYRPLIAVANPLGSSPNIPDLITRAVDEIISKESEIPDEVTGQDCLSREQLIELLNRYFNQPVGLEVGIARATDNGSSPKPPDLVDPSILSKPVMTDQECLQADVRQILESDDVISGQTTAFWYETSTIDKLVALIDRESERRAQLYVRARNTRDPQSRADGEECSHPGCKGHLSHPCEGCGRIGAQGVYLAHRVRSDIPNFSNPPVSSPGVSIRTVDEDTFAKPVDPDALKKESEQLIKSIKERAALFVQDNTLRLSTVHHDEQGVAYLKLRKVDSLFEAAMLIGASIAMERSAEPVNLDVLESIFRVAGDAQIACRLSKQQSDSGSSESGIVRQ